MKSTARSTACLKELDKLETASLLVGQVRRQQLLPLDPIRRGRDRGRRLVRDAAADVPVLLRAAWAGTSANTARRTAPRRGSRKSRSTSRARWPSATSPPNAAPTAWRVSARSTPRANARPASAPSMSCLSSPTPADPEVNEQYLEATPFARSSGPGGQNVNKVASAIRLVYKDAGHERVDHDRCFRRAETRAEQEDRDVDAPRQARIDRRRKATGRKRSKRPAAASTAAGAAQIRSYVFYDNRVKDHRTNHEQPNPQNVLDGDLQGFIDAELQRRAKGN